MSWLEYVPWRTGRKVGRTVYAMVDGEPSDADQLIGLMDSEGLAAVTVAAHNFYLAKQQKLARIVADVVDEPEHGTGAGQ